jgi:multimeric flavodoxin WrbA
MHKVMAINGSPSMEKGHTAVLLDAFLSGMTQAGGDVDLVYASRLDIQPCTCGQMYCWYQKPGECCVRDEMQALYPRLRAADTLVLATPVYIPLPGRMQDLINRLCPLLEPRLEWRDGRTRARFRDDVRIQRIALVSTGGWWEKGNMDVVVHIARELAENASVPFAGAVLRPHAFVMRTRDGVTEDGREVLEAARRAGQELVSEGAMRPETLETVSRDLISEEAMRRMYNDWVDRTRVLDEGMRSG